MIRWITDRLGTSAWDFAHSLSGFYLVDVRELVDKSGNTMDSIKAKIAEAVEHLGFGEKVVICCDYGVSRSNAVAIGVIALYQGIGMDNAIKLVVDATGEKAIKLEVLHSVRMALNEVSEHGENKTNLIITGGSGYIGGLLMKRLEKDCDVCAPSHRDIDLLSDTIVLEAWVKKHHIGTLIHLAAPAVINTNQALGDALLMLKNVLDVCRENKVRLVFISSWEVFSGYKNGIQIVDEATRPVASTIFGMTKLLSEELIYQYGRSSGLNYVIFRPTVVYGAGSPKPRFLVNFIDRARKNEVITTHEYLNGLPFLDLLHVNDLLDGIQNSLNSKLHGVVNLGSGVLFSTREIAESIVSHLGSESAVTQVLIDEMIGHVQFSATQATRDLGWRPRVSWSDGVNEFL